MLRGGYFCIGLTVYGVGNVSVLHSNIDGFEH